MSSSRRIRDELVDPSPDASHSQDILEVDFLAMILWVDNMESVVPTVP